MQIKLQLTEIGAVGTAGTWGRLAGGKDWNKVVLVKDKWGLLKTISLGAI